MTDSQAQQNQSTKQMQSQMQRDRPVVKTNSGYIGQINSPVYNIKIYQGDHGRSPTQRRTTSESPEAPQARSPSFYAMSKPPRPSSSNVYAATKKEANQVEPDQRKKQRPMTAGGAGAHRLTQTAAGGGLLLEQPDANQQLIQQIPSGNIDFQLQERPISAATYQQLRRASRGRNHRNFASQGQLSDYRFKDHALVDQQVAGQAHLDVLTVGRPMPLDQASLKQMREANILEKMLQEGHFFQPETNVGSERGIQRTKSCYSNVFNKTTPKSIVPNTRYVQTNSGKTGYVSVPNKSQKILEKAYKVESKTLNMPQPLDLKTEPMRSLQGPVFTEMVHLHKQKNRRKHGFNRTKQGGVSSASGARDGVSGGRHGKLQQQDRDRNQGPSQNEDLFFSPINEFMRQNFNGQEGATRTKEGPTQGDSESDGRSDDSRDSVPALTGAAHILMERDFFENKYDLEQNGKKIQLCETHFQPIFFAQNTEALRSDVSAQQALKQYRIFVRPEDMHEELKKTPLPQMDIAESLEQRIKRQQDEDLRQYRLRKDKEGTPIVLNRQENIAGHFNAVKNSSRFDEMSKKRAATHISNQVQDSSEWGSGGSRKIMRAKALKARKATREVSKRRLLYGVKQTSHIHHLKGMIEPLAIQTKQTVKGEATIVKGNSFGKMASPLGWGLTSGRKKSMGPLSESQRQLVDRLSQPMTSNSPLPQRRLLRDRAGSQKSMMPLSPQSLEQAPVNSPSIKGRPLNQSNSRARESQMSQVSSDLESNILSSSKKQPQRAIVNQTPLSQPAMVSQQRSKALQKHNQSQSTDNSAPKNPQVFRPFSASTGGGGAYNKPSFQHSKHRSQVDVGQAKQLKKSSTTTPNQAQTDKVQASRAKKGKEGGVIRNSMTVLSNSTTQRAAHPSARPAKKSVGHPGGAMAAAKKGSSVFSADQRVSSAQRSASRPYAANSRKQVVTTSSDKYTATIKTMSQKTGTVTDRRTELSQAYNAAATTKHIDSKMSESATNNESDKTQTTRIGRIQQNIQVTVPNLSHSQYGLDSDADYLKIHNQEKSEEPESQNATHQPDKVVAVEVPTNQPVSVVVTQLDEFVQKKLTLSPQSQSDSVITGTQVGVNSESQTPMSRQVSARVDVEIGNLDDPVNGWGNKDQSNEPTPILHDQPAYAEDSKDLDDNDGTPIGMSQPNMAEHDIQFNIPIDKMSHSWTTSEKPSKTSSRLAHTNTQNTQNLEGILEPMILTPDSSSNQPTELSSRPKASANQTAQGRQSPSQNKVPQLKFSQIDSQHQRRQKSIKEKKTEDRDAFLSALSNIQTCEKPNTDRNITKEFSQAESSVLSRDLPQIDLPENFNQALNVPAAQNSRRRHYLKQRQITKDSNSSVLTPMFYKTHHSGKLGGTPSAQSDFSFAADVNRKEIMGELKGSMGSNQSRLMTKRQADPNALLSSKKEGESLDQLSDTTSEERSRQLCNVDLQELGAEYHEESKDVASATPKSAQVVVKPMFDNQ